MKFYNENKTDEFEILAFHDKSARSFSDLDKKLVTPKTRRWNGQDLPFPILLDSTGKTFKQFEIEGIPTLVLFDPEGRIVGKGSVELLKKALKGEVKTPEPVKLAQTTSGEPATAKGGGK